MIRLFKHSEKRQHYPIMLWHNCRACRWNQGLCLAPFEPRIVGSKSGRVILCIDREPWGDLALRQAEQVAAGGVE